jgi:CCR4-NOT transcription complex subunit 2
MKKNVSLFNNQQIEKKNFKAINSNSFLKPAFFGKFTNETLFYIFYYMARDTLQICAAEELYKRKWRYHVEYNVWFILDGNDGENYMYFNYNEWKQMRYAYGQVNTKNFLPENEVAKYYKSFNIEK